MLLYGAMPPRWHPDKSGNPLVPSLAECGSPSTSRTTVLRESLPDLERQLAAELEGASWAVVAFVPEDAIWCDWVYRNLNGYPLPPTLVDRITPHGFPRPDCLSIFPDRRDPDHEAHQAAALEGSAYLIVVCSPHSAHSDAVAEQIRAFKRAGGEERIVVLVVDGTPDPQLGERLRAPKCDWLPVWLAWRLEESGFRAADRSEPRIVDARRGYRSLKQVRDSLLSALVDIDLGELDRLGGCTRPTESVTSTQPAHVESAQMTPALASSPPEFATSRGNSKFTIITACVLILVAIVFGTQSFLEITSDEPVSTLDVPHVRGTLPGHAAKVKAAEEDAFTAALAQESAAAAAAAAPAPAPEPPQPIVAKSAPPPVEAPAAQPVVPVVQANVPQIIPGAGFATSRILPSHPAGDQAAQLAYVAPSTVNAPSPSSSENDAVLLDEVRTLERRGDETMSERRTDDALDLYTTALSSAEEYAARKGANPTAKSQVFNLMRKLGTLQMQLSSTAEARTTYSQARKVLLDIKHNGTWNRDMAKQLDEIDSRLLSLPRD